MSEAAPLLSPVAQCLLLLLVLSCAHSNRSVSQLSLGKAQEALADAEQACELRPDWEKGHFRRAAALEAQGQLKQATRV